MEAERVLPAGKVVLVVANAPIGGARLERVVGMLGDAHALTVKLEDAATRLAEMAAPAAILIDAEDLTATHEQGLGELIGACIENKRPAVVMMTVGQLDNIGGMLVGNDAILLCDADDAEIAVALATAIADSGLVLRDTSADAARRQRIQEEVARFAATLTQIVDRSSAQDGRTADTPFVAEQSNGFGAQEVEVDPAELRRAIRTRRMRDDVFALPGLFEDPAWDMLLDLFAAQLERRQVSVSSLCIAAAVAPTTALRWIGKLIDAKLLERQPDAFDRRRAYISLTARASVAMRNYVATVRRAGLTIA